MNTAEKIGLLQRQIDDANDGQPRDFNVWRQTTGVVLRTVLGDTNPLYDNFEHTSDMG